MPAVEARLTGRSLFETLPIDRGGPDLIEGLIPRSSSVLIYGKRGSLKSWLALALTIRASVPGRILGKLTVENPVRTLLLIDSPPHSQAYFARGGRYDPRQFRILTRHDTLLDLRKFHLPNPVWMDLLVRHAEALHAEHIILDVHRLAKPGRDVMPVTAALEELRDATGATVTVCLQDRAARPERTFPPGNFMAQWAASICWLHAKHEEKAPRRFTSVAFDTHFAASSLERMRLILDVQASEPLRLETL